MSQTDAYIDVVELCGILQCLGFNVKSIDTSDGNSSHDSARTVVVDCQASGLHVVLESGNLTCSCPSVANQHNNGIWQVSGITGGKQINKEFGTTILGALPKSHRERVTKELQNIVRCIKEHNESDSDKLKDGINRSASMVEMKTPEKKHLELKSETPTRYRSLDTLTTTRTGPDSLPAPGPLQKQIDKDIDNNRKVMYQRQSTYTISSTPECSRRRNKTSSPIHGSSNVLESLIAAEKAADDLRNKLSNVVKELAEEGKYDSSSSLALDVSKISVLKVPESTRFPFASSPNLFEPVQDDCIKKLKSIESASTSNLLSKPAAGKGTKLRRISPSLLFKNNSKLTPKINRPKSEDNKNSKLNSLFKPKIVTPVQVKRTSTSESPNISGTRKKFSNVKSTIPRPTFKKE